MSILHSLDYCIFVVSFEISSFNCSNFVLLFQDCFGYSALVDFLYEFLDPLVNVFNKARWDSDRDYIQSVRQFGKCCHLFNNIQSSVV